MNRNNKKILLVLTLLFFVISLTACSKIPNSLYKFFLDPPTIEVNGLNLTWNEVENAEKYKIYNADNHKYIDETTELSYKFTNIIEDINVYVKSFFNEENFKFKNSESSNVVTVSVPKLNAPFLTSSDNYVSWSKIENAKYYKVFNANDDTEITQTEDLQYEFSDNFNANLYVYVRAYYENSDLDLKKSDKSNIVKVNPDILSIDVSKTTTSTSFEIGKYVKKVVFTGKSTLNWKILVQKRSTELKITFNNLDVMVSGMFLDASKSDLVTLDIVGSCSIISKASDAIVANKIIITGNENSILSVTGGNGIDGSSGSSGASGSTTGGNGGAGGNGGNKGNTLSIYYTYSSNNSISIYQGKNGSVGTGGAGGSTSATANNHSAVKASDGNKGQAGSNGY